MAKTYLSDDELRRKLTPEQYHVLREGGTERPFENQYFNFDGQGLYHCAACGATLFKSDDKYSSRQWGLEGWPSFALTAAEAAIEIRDDTRYGLQRDEIICTTCGSHLGHVFPDNSSPSGQHFCVNSAALDFDPKKD